MSPKVALLVILYLLATSLTTSMGIEIHGNWGHSADTDNDKYGYDYEYPYGGYGSGYHECRGYGGGYPDRGGGYGGGYYPGRGGYGGGPGYRGY